MKGSSSAAGRWGRCLRAPFRVLSSVRDLYIKGMNGCAGRVQYGAAAVAYPSFAEFRGSSSFNSARSSTSDEDLRDLIRAASRREMPVRRSQSVVVGRIDEDAPCEFKDDVKLGNDLLFPRSKSYAVGGKRMVRALA